MPRALSSRPINCTNAGIFSETIRLLESQVFRFRDSNHFYLLLGSACLYSGDFGGAESYLKRAEQLEPNTIETLLGLAVVYLRRSDIDEALKKWLAVVDRVPRNAVAQRGLNFLRKGPPSEKIAELIDTGKVKRLYPPIPFHPRQVLIPALALAAAGFLVLSFVYLLPRLPRREPRPGIQDIVLSPDAPSLSGDQENPAIVLNEQEINTTFELIKEYLLEYRDNLAIREINRIKLSNASAYVKEKAALLKTFVTDPDFTSVKDPFTYIEVIGHPALYQHTYVVWTGKTANTAVDERSIHFDLLVGYQDEKALLGIVPVLFTFAVPVEDGQAVEVLGRLEITAEKLTLAGISIHPLLVSE